VRVVHLSDPVTVVLDIVAWGLIHAGAGYAAHRTSVAWLSRDRALFRERAVERGGRLYTKVLRIGRWKDRLPEAGALFAGGISKRHVTAAELGGLDRFVVETRRAELGHWLAAAPGVLFVLWNPPAVVPVMVAYGLLVNLPFIAVQRYNRIRACRVLRARAARASRAAPAGSSERGARDSGSAPAAAAARARRRSSRDVTGSSIP
jgi:glycosyl-4,4'-diaponeurosporenoate acyltransferase